MKLFTSILTALILVFANGLKAQEQEFPPPPLATPVNLVAAEFFFDSDPGAGNGTSLPVNQELASVSIENYVIDVDGLSAGFHALYVRFKDDDGLWGTPSKKLFYKPEEQIESLISGAEIFFDEKTDFGSGISIPINNGKTITKEFEFDIDANQLNAGFHKAYTRLMDNDGTWGNYQSFLFVVPEFKEITQVNGAEYFYDILGQPGTGTLIDATSSPIDGSVTITDKEIDAPNGEGFHRLFIRFKDADNTYGIPSKFITYLPSLRKTSTISELEYFLETDPGLGSGEKVEIQTPISTFSKTIDIPLDGFKIGFNNFFTRLKDADGNWGNYVKQLVYVPKSKLETPVITDMEYFLSDSARPADGEGLKLESTSSSGLFDSILVNAKTLVTLTQSVGNQAVYVRAKDASNNWGVPVPAPITIANQRDFQGQVYDNGEFLSNRDVSLYKDRIWASSTTIGDYGLFTFQSLDAGSYEVRLNQSTTKKLGAEIPDIGVTGPKTISSADQDLILADILVAKPLHVIATNPTPYFSRIKPTDFIEVSFSSKFIPSTINAENVHLNSDLRGELSIQITKQNNDSVLTIKPNKSLLTNEKITLLIDATYQSQTNLPVTPYTTHFRVQVTGGGIDSWEEKLTDTGSATLAHFAYGDFDADNDIDVAVMSYNPNSIILFLNDGDGNFEKGSTIDLSTVNSLNLGYLFIGDFDRDGDIDIGALQVSGYNNTKDGLVTLFSNSGNGVFTEKYSLDIQLRTTAYEPMIGFYQLDYDAYPEIVVLTGGQDTGVIIIHNNEGVFSDDTGIDGNITILPKYTGNLAFGDFTGDGMTDYLIGNMYYNQQDPLFIGQDNKISTTFSNERLFTKDLVTNAYYYLAEDLDRDSKLDLTIFTSQGINHYQDDAQDSISYLDRNSASSHMLRYNNKDNFTIGDIDADGKLDVVALQNSANFFNYFNVSQDVFDYRGKVFESNKSLNLYPKLADLNRDGALDLFYLSKSNSNNYDITVQINKSVPTNDPPIIANIIADLDLFTSQDSTEISLTSTFSDPNSDDLILTVQSSNIDVVRTTISGSKLTLFPEAIGNSTITVTADDDRGGNVSTNFIVYVNASDNFTPRVASPISDIDTRIADDSTEVNLTTVFNDPDTGDVLTFTTNNPNPSVANVYIHNNSTLIISPVGIGSATIIVTASDGKASAQNSFIVAVGPRENRAPNVLATIPNQSTNLGDSAIQLDPDLYFIDPDGDELTYSITADNSTIAGGSYDAANNKILITGSSAGRTVLTITAQDPGGKTNSASFSLYVNAKPEIIATISDVILVLGGNSAIYTLDAIFSDDNNEALTYTGSSTNPSIANLAVNTSNNTLTITAFSEGEAILSLKALDANTESENLTINVTVKTQNFSTQSSGSSASAYPDGITVKNWTLISIPGSGVNSTPSELFKDVIPNNDFRLFDVNTNGEYINVSDEAGPVLSTGKSLWFKTLGVDQKFTLQTGAGNRINSRTHNINVFNYQFISNPYETEAAWTKDDNLIKMWKFSSVSQSWISVQTDEKLKPWGGYVVFAPTSSKITLYLDAVSPKPSANFNVPMEQPEIEEFQIKADIFVDDEILSLENRALAETKYDAFDEPLLPSTPDSKVKPTYLKSEKYALSKDAQPLLLSDEDLILNYRTIVIPKGHHKISWSGNEFDESHVLALVSEDMYKILEVGDSLSWINASKDRVFKAYIGSRELVEKSVLPEKPFLFENFPNPFNPTTVLRFAVTKPAHVRLEVFDILGRKVAILVNSAKQAGYHTTNFSGTQLASGVYLYRLTIDNQVVDVKKMTLLK